MISLKSRRLLTNEIYVMSTLRTRTEKATGLILWTLLFALLAYCSRYIKDAGWSVVATLAGCLLFGSTIAVIIVWVDGFFNKKLVDRLIELAAWSFIVWLLGNINRVTDIGDRALFTVLVALGFAFIDDLKSVIKNKVGYAFINFIYWTSVAFFTANFYKHPGFKDNLLISACIGLAFTAISMILRPMFDSWKARLKQKRADKKAFHNSEQ